MILALLRPITQQLLNFKHVLKFSESQWLFSKADV